jgi:hypothetical protein
MEQEGSNGRADEDRHGHVTASTKENLMKYRMANDTERALRARAKRLGYRIRRRGNHYRLIDDAEGEEIGSQDITAINWYLAVIEHKLPVQFSTACGIPLWTINANEKDR